MKKGTIITLIVFIVICLITTSVVLSIALTGGFDSTLEVEDRESEAITSVRNHLYNLAESHKANWYVSRIIGDYFWGAEYLPNTNNDRCGGKPGECWHVYNLAGCATCGSYAHWFVHGSDMNEVIAGDDAISIERAIKDLNIDPTTLTPGVDAEYLY